MATTDLKTGATVTMQVPLYDPAGSGESAYGRYALSDLLANAFDGITAESIITALAATFPSITVTLGGANPPSQAVIDTLVSYGVLEGNILAAQTNAQPTLIVANMSSASSLGSVALVQASGVLAVSGLSSASSLGTITLSLQGEEGGTLTVAGLSSASSLATITLVQSHGELTVANLSSASSLGSITISEQTTSNNFSDDFSGDLSQWTTSNGTPTISSGRLLLNSVNERLYATTDMTRGFYVQYDLQLPGPATANADTSYIEVGASTTYGATGSYRINVYNYLDEEDTPLGGIDIMKNGSNITTTGDVGSLYSETSRTIRIEFYSSGAGAPNTSDIVVKVDGVEKLRADNDATYSSFSYLFISGTGLADSVYFDNISVGSL